MHMAPCACNKNTTQNTSKSHLFNPGILKKNVSYWLHTTNKVFKVHVNHSTVCIVSARFLGVNTLLPHIYYKSWRNSPKIMNASWVFISHQLPLANNHSKAVTAEVRQSQWLVSQPHCPDILDTLHCEIWLLANKKQNCLEMNPLTRRWQRGSIWWTNPIPSPSTEMS